METGRIIQTSATTVVADLSHSRESALWLTMETRKYKGVRIREGERGPEKMSEDQRR